ncbi:MAG: hypothetical protein ACJAVA_000374 [Flavobacteriaceae bacterium]|jgi:hypothetical protein
MIKKFIDSLEDDKKDHVILGQIYAFFITPIALIFGVAFYFFVPIEVLVWVIFSAATFVFLVGTSFNAWKEVIHDWYYGKGNAEWLDFLATEIPLLTSYLPYMIMLIVSYYL